MVRTVASCKDDVSDGDGWWLIHGWSWKMEVTNDEGAGNVDCRRSLSHSGLPNALCEGDARRCKLLK